METLAKSQTLEKEIGKDEIMVSGVDETQTLPSEVSVARVQESGVRVSVNKNVGVDKEDESKLDGLSGGDSVKEIEVSENGISLMVEVQGSSACLVQDNGNEAIGHLGFSVSNENPTVGCEGRERTLGDQKTVFKEVLLPEKREKPGAEVSEMSVPKEKNDNVEEKEEGEVEKVDHREHKFSIGDFVWGKIKSHPWWPGQIYDPSNASNYAAKYHRRDRFLVACFGDGTFARCYPSQLQPFEENFELMSKQSNSKSFLKAVEDAVAEIGRRVELEMTCDCVPEETRTKLIRPLAVNAGIKEEVAVPEGLIGEFSITYYEPTRFLARLRHMAQVISATSMLELTVFSSRLSAFNHAKGYRQLPIYHEAQGISDPEEHDRDEVMNKSNVDGQTGDLTLSPAEVDAFSSPTGPGVGKNNQTSARRGPEISDGKLHQRKKQRSMTELLARDKDVPENHESDAGQVGIVSSKPTSTSKKWGRNKISVEDLGVNKLGSLSKKRKKSKLSGSPPVAEKKPSIVNDDRGAKRAITGSLTRSRKKSKYLSPPYIDIIRGNKTLSKDSETETPKVTKVSLIEECIRRAAAQRTGTSPIVKCSGKTFHKKPSKETGIGHKTSGNLSPRTLKRGQNKIVPMETNASANEILSEFCTAALDPFYLKGSSLDTIMSFFSRFRSSLYSDGSNFQMYNKHLSLQGSGKRKSLETIPSSLGKDSQVTDHPSSERKSKRKNRKKGEAMTRSPRSKLEHSVGKSDLKTKHNEETNEEASAAYLLLTFGPGFPLPSKDDLIKTFGGFGALNELETEALKKSSCARVAFVRSSDAETAFNSLEKMSPFGDAVVSYRLRYPSATSKALNLDWSSHQIPPTPSEGDKHPANSSTLMSPVEEAPPLLFIRQRLEMMKSVLEKSGDKEVKSKLQGEIKGLLKKLSTMDDSSS